MLSLLSLLSSFAAFCWTKTVHLRLREQTLFSAEKAAALTGYWTQIQLAVLANF